MKSRADFVFQSAKVAVFVDGCFWHGCPQHATWPAANALWWRNKIEANRQRDCEATARLEAAGWYVMRIWEHEASDAADTVALQVRQRRTPGKSSVRTLPRC
jgi:DNA mismatch endonuclease (patch repair protein)